jgi:hypothetical protein
VATAVALGGDCIADIAVPSAAGRIIHHGH